MPDESEAPVLAPGTRLGKYAINRQLGSGGMGAVYEATHTEIGKRVAIKVLSPSIAAIPGARARFLREAQLTSKIRHPNIVDVADMGNDGGQTYIVMELLAGEDLAGRLQRGPLPAGELADVMLPVCAAVVAAHRAGVTHRDLKPQNIFLARGPHGLQPKVLDFGISKGADTVGAGTLTGTGSIIGTPFYFAPEQIVDARAAGPGTDQYALGVIMYECLTGVRPYEADTLFIVFQAIVNGSPVPLRTHRPELPPALEAIVLRAMNVDAKRRFSSTDELGRALLPFASPRQRSIWEDAFDSNAPADVNPPVRPTAPVAGARSGSTAPMQLGVATPPPPGVMTPVPPGVMTPVPPAATSAPGFRPSAALAAGDSFAAAPAPSGKGKWIAIAAAAVIVAAGGGWMALRGQAQPAPAATPQPMAAPAPSPAPAVKAPAPAPSPAAVAPAPAAKAPPPAAPAEAPPAEVKSSPPSPPAAAAERPTPSHSTHSSSHTRTRSKPASPAAPKSPALNPNAAPVVD